MTRRTRVRLALLGLSGLCALVLVEAVTRLWLGPPALREVLQMAPELGFRSRPGAIERSFDQRGEFTFRLNRLGFRGAEPPTGPPQKKRRLLFVGDSFAYAGSVRDEELVTNASVRALAARGIEAEAFNLGCTGYSTAQELLVWRRHGVPARPDDVVLMLFAINDVPTNSFELAGHTLGNTDDYLRPYLDERGSEIRYLYPARAFLRHRLLTFAWFEERLLATAAERGWSWPRVPWGEQELLRAAPELLRAPEGDGPWERAWRHTEGLLRTFRDEVRASGARFLVLLIPNDHQVVLQGDTTSEAEGDVEVDWNYPERRLQAFFAREGIEAVLLLEPLRAALARDPAPLYAQDKHVTGRAHGLAAELVADCLAAERCPPCAAGFTAPVDLRSAERRIAFLDLSAEPRLEFLGEGFGQWMPNWLGHGPGIPMASRARVFLQRGEGDLVVRGLLSRRGSKLGLELTLALGQPPLRKSFALTGPDPFECRIPTAELGLEAGAAVDLELAIAAEGEAQPLEWPVFLREIGFARDE